MIASYDAAVIDKESDTPHIVKRMDRPRIRIIAEVFGSGTLPRKSSTGRPGRRRQPARTDRGQRADELREAL